MCINLCKQTIKNVFQLLLMSNIALKLLKHIGVRFYTKG